MRKHLINTVKRSPLANTIALHDFAITTHDLRGWVAYTVGLFKECGLEPTRMGITAPSIKSTKMHTYKREIKKLDQLDNEIITSITLQATMNGSDDSHGDQIFTAWLSIRDESPSCVLTLDDTLAPFESDRWNDIVKHMAAFFRPRYGYGYQRPYEKGPEWYPFGVCVLEYGDPEAKIIGCWSKTYHSSKYRTGDMRDIYPLNVLSSAHNQRMVDGMALFDWINSDKSRGNLTKLDADLWSWWVKDEDIDSVRATLKPTGILLCAP